METLKYVSGGVCAPQGFKANGIFCGIKQLVKKDGNDSPFKTKNDLGLIFSDVLCNTAAVYTLNKVKAAPIIVTKENLLSSGFKARAVIVNSGNANACTADGADSARKMCSLAANALDIPCNQVIVASTGVIGQTLPVEPIERGIEELAAGLSVEGNQAAAEAIMTTDTFKKEVAVEFILDGKTCRLGAMAKGSGMINPNMATNLNFITTDAAVSSEMLHKALSETVKITFNCLTIDGDTSTNDMVSLMASGLAGNKEIAENGTDFDIFKNALFMVMRDLTKMLAKDGEGATKLIECECDTAPDFKTAIAAAKSVISSSLVKSMIFGEDANCGRILCALGYAAADFDTDKTDIELSSAKGSLVVCEKGLVTGFSEEKAAEILSADEITIKVSLNQGDSKATAWGCDLTYDYVKINGDYRS